MSANIALMQSYLLEKHLQDAQAKKESKQPPPQTAKGLLQAERDIITKASAQAKEFQHQIQGAFNLTDGEMQRIFNTPQNQTENNSNSPYGPGYDIGMIPPEMR